MAGHEGGRDEAQPDGTAEGARDAADIHQAKLREATGGEVLGGDVQPVPQGLGKGDAVKDELAGFDRMNQARDAAIGLALLQDVGARQVPDVADGLAGRAFHGGGERIEDRRHGGKVHGQIPLTRNLRRAVGRRSSGRGRAGCVHQTMSLSSLLSL